MNHPVSYIRRRKLAAYLIYFGALPFFFSTLLLVCHVHHLPVLGGVERAMSVYALIVASFVNGAHWGQHLERTNHWSLFLPIVSNVNAVLLWVCYLALPFVGFVVALSLSFLITLSIDHVLYDSGLIDRPYFRVRCIATALILTPLFVAVYITLH